MTSAVKILLIDDNDEMGSLIQDGLEKDFQVDYAPDAFTAQQYVAHHSYELILCDIQMPFVNGLILIEEFRKKNISIPFIFISGEINQAVSTRALELGAYNVLAKPFRLATLREKIKLALSLAKNTVTQQEDLDGQEMGHLYNLLKSHYYDYEKIMYNLQFYKIPLKLIASELEKKARSGRCLLDDPEYLTALKTANPA